MSVTAIDLFAGAGGFSLGLQQAGIHVLAAIEWDEDAAATYRAMIGDHVIEQDIATVDPATLPDVDLIAGSPPCQSFSVAGKRDPNDPRGELWREFVRIVAAKRPAWVLLENVPGIISAGVDIPIMEAFRELGYRIHRYTLCAHNYGVPQSRNRVFFIGNRIGAPIKPPRITHVEPHQVALSGLLPWVTVRQALGIGGQMTQKYSVTNRLETDGRTSPWYDGDSQPARTISHEPHKTLDEPSLTIRAGAHGQPGYSPRHQGGYVPCIPLDSPSPTISGVGSDTGGDEPIRHRLTVRGTASGDGDGATLDQPGPAVSATFGLEFVDPSQQREYTDANGRTHSRPSNQARYRRLTVHECQLLQDFPAWFVFVGCKTSQHRQIGNAVPPGMARALGDMIVREHSRLAATL